MIERLPETKLFTLCIASDHLACDIDDGTTGCLRCNARAPTICCELCHPPPFVDFARVDVARPKKGRNRARITPYDLQPHDMELRRALDDFRKAETIKQFSLATLKNSGPGIILPNKILQRIVDCAHTSKIPNVEELKFQTRWQHADTLGAHILTLVSANAPPAPPPVTPKPRRLVHPSPANGLLASVPAVLLRKCGRCGEYGHISTSHFPTRMLISPTNNFEQDLMPKSAHYMFLRQGKRT